MRASLAKEVNRILILVAASLLLCLLWRTIWPLIAGLGLYIIWSTRQLFALYTWLVREEHTDPPDAAGLWGEFYTRLEHLFRQERRAQDNLQGIIQRAQESVNALEDVVVMIDQHGHLEYWNHAAQKHLGLRPDKDLGQPLTNLIRHPRFTHYLAKGRFNEPLEIPAPVDDNRILQFRITEFGEGDQLILARDMTRLHHLEEMRKDFVANVSHELKTPLTVLKGYLETLLDTVPEEQTGCAAPCTTWTPRATAWRPWSTTSCCCHGWRTPRPTTPGRPWRCTACCTACARTPWPWRGKRITRSPGGARGRAPGGQPGGTGKRLRQPDHQRGEIHAGAGAHSHRVAPGRPGRPPVGERRWPRHRSAAHSRLTERFYRPDNSRVTQTGGTGLGLAIVKHVMLRHDGKLEIQSALGKGSTFTCHFPPARVAGKPAVTNP